jgi:hypothetical protein
MDNKENKTNKDSQPNKDLEPQNEETNFEEYFRRVCGRSIGSTSGMSGFILKTDNSPSKKKKT